MLIAIAKYEFKRDTCDKYFSNILITRLQTYAKADRKYMVAHENKFIYNMRFK